MTQEDNEFVEATQRLGLNNEDIKTFGGGFETPDSGLPATRADIIAHNKQVITDPKTQEAVAEAVKQFQARL